MQHTHVAKLRVLLSRIDAHAAEAAPWAVAVDMYAFALDVLMVRINSQWERRLWPNIRPGRCMQLFNLYSALRERSSRLCAGVTQVSAFGVQGNSLEDPTSELRTVRDNTVNMLKALGKIALQPWKGWFW